MTKRDFLAGYGAAQAVPGPLFTFAAYLGAVEAPAPNGVAGRRARAGRDLPAGPVAAWSASRRSGRCCGARPGSAAVLAGVNAAVVGLLVAALYRPLLTTAVGDALDVAVVLAALLLLVRVPPWAVVAACAVAGQLLA